MADAVADSGCAILRLCRHLVLLQICLVACLRRHACHAHLCLVELPLCEHKLLLLPYCRVARHVTPKFAIFFFERVFGSFQVLNELFQLRLLASEMVLFKLPVSPLFFNRKQQLCALLLSLFCSFLGICQPLLVVLLVSI